MNIQEAVHALAQDPQVMQRGSEKMNRLLSRSAADAAFRQKLLTNPRAAIAEFTGKPAPEPFNVVFVENTADATFVLPDPIDAAVAVSDDELEAVAGGSSTACAATLLAILVELDKIIGD
jgi:hypothetical protein